MKRLLFLAACAGTLLCAADLESVHNVYVMPMAKGSRPVPCQPAHQRPRLPDRDRSQTGRRRPGRPCRRKLADPTRNHFPDTQAPGRAAPAEEPEKPAKSEKASKRDTDKDKVGRQSHVPGHGEQAGQSRRRTPRSDAAKATIFLVDAKSRQVVWSTLQPAKRGRRKDLDRTASDIVSRIKKDLNPEEVALILFSFTISR